MNLHLEHKEWIGLFALVIPLVVLFYYLLQWKKKVRKSIGDETRLNILTGNFSPNLFRIKSLLLFVAFVLGIVGLINPRQPNGAANTTKKGIDIAIALDVSKSMIATDVLPSRMEQAKQFINQLVSKLQNDRVSLIFFAGKSYLQMPLTTDLGAIQMFLSSAAPEAVPQQGTDISDALKMSEKSFFDDKAHFKSILLITDGEDHEGGVISVAEDLANKGVMINTIGVGTSDGSELIDTATNKAYRDDKDNIIISKIDEPLLKEIATKTKGIYVHLQNNDDAVNSIYNQLSHIDKSAFTDISDMKFVNYVFPIALIIFLILLVEKLIPEIKTSSLF